MAENKEYHSVDYNPFEGEVQPFWCPLTESQKEIWISTLMSDEANCAYNECIGLELYGDLNINYFEEAVRKTFQRHDALRAYFDVDGEKMYFSENTDFVIDYHDFTVFDEPLAKNKTEELLVSRVLKPFDLTEFPLFHLDLITFNSSYHLFVITIHHMICDGWSLGVLLTEISKIYTSKVKGEPLDLQPAVQFYTFAHESEMYYHSEAFEKVLNFWLKCFEKGITPLELPVEFKRPDVRTFRGNRVDKAVSAELIELLKNTSARYKISFVNLLLALFEAYLSRITGQEEILIGLPAAAQSFHGYHDLVGHCVNLLPVCSRVNHQQKFEDYLLERKKFLLDAFENQQITYGKLVKKLKFERDLSRVPVIPVVFNVDMGLDDGVVFEGLKHKLVSNPRKAENFELFLNITGNNEEIVLEFSYNTSLFSFSRIEQIADEFITFCASACRQPQNRISEIEILPEWEKKLLLRDWCFPQSEYPRNKTVHEIFEETAAKFKDKTALIFKNTTISYHELNIRSNQLANLLISMGITPGSKIAVSLNSSIEMITALLAILKTGSCYIPLPLNFPEYRLEKILNEVQLNVIIKKSTYKPDFLKNISYLEINIDELPELSSFSAENPKVKVSADDVAYIMFTSGSTGEPKGVCIPHRGIVRLVKGNDYIEFNPDLVFLQHSNIGFDASTFEIWGSLLNGSSLVIMPEEHYNLSEFAAVIEKYQVNVLWLTSGFFSLMVDHEATSLKNLKYLLAGGDVLSVGHVIKALGVLGPGKLINGYGPTENTTFTTTYRIDDVNQVLNSVPIGKPIKNTSVYILDADMNVVPIGVKGELYTGGDGLAKGYLNNDKLTQQKFIFHTFENNTTIKLYRTGDFARWRRDGNIEFFGRVDNQVKIRGYRIEINELERYILTYPAVSACAVVVSNDDVINKKLLAYVVFKDDKEDVSGLREYLSVRLPEYMIPSIFISIKELPLNEQGKVDKLKLLENKLEISEKKEIIQPISKLEQNILDIWKQYIGIQHIDVNSSFFNIGGQSLIAVQILAEIEKQYHIRLPLSVFFENSTVRSLSKVVASKAEAISWQSLVTINSKGNKIPLFLVHGAGMNVVLFEALSRHLPADQPVYALQAKGLDGKSEPLDSIKDMAAYYISEVLRVCPDKPVALAGYSLGGYIAFEMAQQLKKMDREVSFLALFDTDAYVNGFYHLPEHCTAFTKSIFFLYFQFRRFLFLFYVFLLHPLHFIREKKRVIQMKVKMKKYRKKLSYQKTSTDSMTPIEKVEQAGLNAICHYVPEIYEGDIYLFKAKNKTYFIEDRQYYGWKKFIKGNIFTYVVPGDHADMFSPPNDSAFASVLLRCLNQANEKFRDASAK